MNTGHDGSLTTLHANSPEDMIIRLVTMVRYGFDLPVEVIEENIASAIDVAVQTSRSRDGTRFVSAIAEMHRGENSACVADLCLLGDLLKARECGRGRLVARRRDRYGAY